MMTSDIGRLAPKDVEPWLPPAQHFVEWLLELKHWNTPEAWIARVALWILVVYALLRAIRAALELLLQLKQFWAGLGLRVRRYSEEERAQLRRRQQFTRVLTSDLATLAKVENWNDQFYTDLEAQIEAEGKFYATNFERLIHRSSDGLRRVSSLIRAIESSAEQFLLLIGEPGSGKSVALRHLAHQLAERATTSRSRRVTLPLYVNLKELPPPPPDGPTADFIKQFVLTNVRRGDADTAEYIRDNWDNYRASGAWFFLFDSFDEIPAVLHAPTGSKIALQHADAIRQFLAGMSTCRGILASREFKGPTSLGWHRLRILALNDEKQSQLVANSFLPRGKRQLVLQHIATAESTIHQNPMYLSLLCRFVRDENALPKNDHEVLNRHITRLADRDADHVLSKYNLTPQQLVGGAVVVARLFAEQAQLSLAPTLNDISSLLPAGDVPGGDIENLLAALVDVKIGRTDVQEARAGDRRFTFAHRRYQETLFVDFLSKHPGYISSRVFLTDSRWREYAVTFLQTQPIEAILPILGTATELLREYEARNSYAKVPAEYGSDACYFRWDDSTPRLLSLLEEGLASRPSEVPPDLREGVAQILLRRWDEGDFFDRFNVLKICGLLPPDNLARVLGEAARNGSHDTINLAVRKTMFLTNVPTELGKWIRQRLSADVLRAARTADITRAEALAARLPPGIRAQNVVENAKLLRRRITLMVSLVMIPGFLIPAILDAAVGKSSVKEILRQYQRSIIRTAGSNLFIATAVSGIFALNLEISPHPSIQRSLTHLTALLLAVYALSCLFVLVAYGSRSTGSLINAAACLSELRRSIRQRRAALLANALLVVAVGVMVTGLLNDRNELRVGALLLPFCAVIAVGFDSLTGVIRQREYRQRFISYSERSKCQVPVVLHATCLREIAYWIEHFSPFKSVRDVRAFGAVLRRCGNRKLKTACTHRPPAVFLTTEDTYDAREIGADLNDIVVVMSRSGKS